ncbi:vanadium-dependent haloperoxidase [Streptomyces minutiscleroticus]|uniref:vanadium-dependent haloperoxidase n=1 Tax=Streptomyces minutiscleroticus TaxID=68238 RepID=UPI0033284FCB
MAQGQTAPHATPRTAPAMRHGAARRAVVAGLSVLALGTTALLPARAATAVRPTADPAVVTGWNATAVDVINKDAERPSGEPFVWQGFVSAAVYNAVVGIEGRYAPYKWDERGPAGASSEAAAAAAAHRVLLEYFPGSKARVDAALRTSLGKVRDGRAEDEGVAFGRRAADRVIALRENDGRGADVPYDRRPAPGVWRPTPPDHAPFLNPWAARMRPMLMESPDRFRPGPPPALDSERYTRDFEEVKAYGAKHGSRRDARQTETARFFSDNLTVQFQWSLRDYAERHGLDIVDSARLFAAANTVGADVYVMATDSKLHYALWRPVTAVRLADTDGNPATVPDQDWQPMLDTPPYPEYMSGHNVLDGAVTAVLTGLTGGEIDLRMSSAVTGTTRHYETAAEFNREVTDARVWQGLHFRTSDAVGNRQGSLLGTWALSRYFLPLA